MTDWIREPARDIEVIDQADVVVLGGGPAGVAAATAAGRLGADVLLVERYGCLGGLATGGLVIILVTLGPRGQVLMSGLAKETVDRLYDYGAAKVHDWRRCEEPVYDPEVLKQICLEQVESANVRLLLHAWVTNASVKDDRLDAVILESKSGRQAIRGKLFIDCTGDGDTAAWANIPFEDTQSPVGLGLDFRWANVDFPRFRKFMDDEPEKMAELRAKMKSAGVPPHPNGSYLDDRAWFITFNPGDALSVRDLTRVELEQRRVAWNAYQFYKANVPGFEDVTILDTASQIGTRESRKITGEYQMTHDDIFSGKTYDDQIGIGVTWRGKSAGTPFWIPYRALVPQQIDNVLYAGRCISATTEAHQETRVIPNCWVTGHAAGVAAGLAVKHAVAPRRLDIADLQQALVQQGVEVSA